MLGREISVCGVRLGLKHSRAVFLITWYLCGIIFVGRAWRYDAGPTRAMAETSRSTQRTNHIRAFRACFAAADGDVKPVFDISWGELRTENTRRGIFSTSLCKTIIVENLRIGVRYDTVPSPRVLGTGSSNISTPPDEPATGVAELWRIVLDRPKDMPSRADRAQLVGWLPGDVRKATDLVIRGFSYSVHCDDELALGIRCRRVVFSRSVPEAVLEGCVTVMGPQGAKLTSSCVRWDLAQNRFTVPPRYAWNRDDSWVRGRGACFDHRLGILTGQETLEKEGVQTWARGAFR